MLNYIKVILYINAQRLSLKGVSTLQAIGNGKGQPLARNGEGENIV